jgi:hypothetical protein
MGGEERRPSFFDLMEMNVCSRAYWLPLYSSSSQHLRHMQYRPLPSKLDNLAKPVISGLRLATLGTRRIELVGLTGL